MRHLLAMVGAFLLVGCGDDWSPTDPVQEDEFVAVISGARSWDLRVASRHLLTTDYWTFIGATDDLQVTLSFDERPEPGEYPLEQHQMPQGQVRTKPYYRGETWTSIDGSIVITSSNADRFAGYFDFTADWDEGPQDHPTIRVRGSFNVACAIGCGASGAAP